jgi:hypothetical protein
MLLPESTFAQKCKLFLSLTSSKFNSISTVPFFLFITVNVFFIGLNINLIVSPFEKLKLFWI